MCIRLEGEVTGLADESYKAKGHSTRYRVRRVGLGSLSKFGCVLGGLASFVPSLAVGWSGMVLVGGLRRVLEGWQRASFHVLGQDIRIDVISLLNLESLLRTVQQIDSLSWALVVLFVVLASLSGAIVFLVAGNLLGWVYNFVAAVSGGLEVELREPSRR